MKHFLLLKQHFPGKRCAVSISDIDGDLEFLIRVGDYFMEISRAYYGKPITEEVIDQGFENLVEALKGKFAGIKEERRLP